MKKEVEELKSAARAAVNELNKWNSLCIADMDENNERTSRHAITRLCKALGQLSAEQRRQKELTS